ncbi:hypothetical protein [Kribbella lupini]|uniref:LysM domain-containing protein n=1 Tax=Kribbella lupini TaxID=291602 RepID=A0ABP4LMC1_9ACTN
MNAMIRGLKALIALGALAAAGLALRWVTAGAMDEASTRDLISMAFVAVAAVAWTAYAWLLLAVLATVLEQAPGVLGRAGAALAGRITSQTSRTLLRSALGVAAVTPLTIGVAHASPANPPQHTTTSGAAWRATEPASTVRLDQPISPNDWRLTEKPSTVRLADAPVQGRPQHEPSSTVQIGRPTGTGTTEQPGGPATSDANDSSRSRTTTARPGEQATAGPGDQAESRPGGQATSRPGGQAEARPGDQTSGSRSESGTTRSAEPGSTRPGDSASGRSGDQLAAKPADGLSRSDDLATTSGGPAQTGDPAATRSDGPARIGQPGGTQLDGPARTGEPRAARPGGPARTGDPVGPRTGEPGIRVPDRPTDGAPVRYTNLASGRHVVLRGESLWSIAAAELGAGASDSAIAARWPHWYAANRAVIGPDPDVLLPGQVLQSPASLDRPVPQTPQEK